MEAGLPNITGELDNSIGPSASAILLNGALYSKRSSGSSFQGGSQFNFHNLGIDASGADNIYGNSTTVTPLSQSTLMLIRY